MDALNSWLLKTVGEIDANTIKDKAVNFIFIRVSFLSLFIYNSYGQTEEGEDVLKTKSFSKVKTDAIDQDVFDVANAIKEVLAHPVFEIRRVDAELLEEGI